MRLARFLLEIKTETAVKIGIGLMITGTYVCQAFAIAGGISAVFAGGGIEQIARFLLTAVAAIALRAWLVRWNEGYTKKMAAKVKGMIRSRMIDKLMLLGPGYLNDKRSGNLQSLITDGVESFEVFLVNYLPQACIVLIAVGSIVSYIITMDWAVGVIILVAAVLAVAAPHLTMPFVSSSTIEYWQSYALLNAQYIDTMQGMNTLKVFNASTAKGRELAANAHVFYRDSIRNTGLSLLDSALIVFLMAAGTAASIGLAAWHTANGTLSATCLVVILFLVAECIRPLNDLNTFWHGSYLGFSVAEQLYGILDEPVVLKEKAEAAQVKLNDRLPSLLFEQVSFRYGEQSQTALNQLSMRVRPGQTVAVVGKSGSGKSTLVNLLLRFYDVSQGRLLIDGQDIKDYSLSYLRSKIAVVFQDTYLFYGTIEENIRMAKPEATAGEMERAARAANAHEFIQKLPDSYQTMVGERGATLSGGERQRIAIARAILKDAPLLILDEATSSVDAASEAVIQNALERLMINRTTVIIAHRLSTIQNAENIFVLEDGLLKEQGSHAELMKLDGAYASLIRAQQKAGEQQ
ncbi:MAG: ATPase and permease component of ABC-type transporter involved in cytochrome bd biosynthesis [Sporomusa sp.]|nr:ATPase and permease component of ABC-type transporter involved in cytochrome bd biosynthesis [Sporomusa sp.]